MISDGKDCGGRDGAVEERHLRCHSHEHVRPPVTVFRGSQEDIPSIVCEALGAKRGGGKGDAPEGLDRVHVQLEHGGEFRVRRRGRDTYLLDFHF